MYKLLIVDDEEIIRTGLQQGIDWEAMGFAPPLTAGNGQEALGIIAGESPHVVLTDIRMPGMDGLELLARIHREYPLIRTVILSGYNDFEYARQGMAFGAETYLLKPTTNREILETFTRLCDDLRQEEGQRQQQEEWRQRSLQVHSLELDRFFRRLVQGDLHEPGRFDEEVRHLQLRIPSRWSCGFVLEPCGEKPGTLPEDLAERLQARLESGPGGSGEGGRLLLRVLAQDANSLAILLFQENPISLAQLDRLAGLAVREASQASGQAFACGVGPPASPSGRVAESLAKSRKAVRMAYYDDAPHLYHWDRIVIGPVTPDLEESVRKTGDELLAALRQSREEPLATVLDAYFGRMRKWKPDPDWLVETTVLLMNRCIQLLEDLSADAGGIRESASFRSLSRCATLTCLKNKVSDQCRIIQARLGEELGSEVVRRAIAYLRENLGSRVRLEDYAASQFLNASYFSAHFKEKTGISFTAYLNNLRIEQAMRLLARHDHHISEIAEQVGFYDTAHFCRVFKRVVGQTPLEYRKRQFL